MGRKDAAFFRKEGANYVYTGAYYRFACDDTSLRGKKRIYASLVLISCALFIVLGINDSPLTVSFLSAIPYVCCVLPLGYMCAGLYSIFRNPSMMNIVQYKSGPRRLKRSAWGLFGASLGSFLGACANAFVIDITKNDIIFFAGTFIMAVAAFLIIRLYRACPARICENEVSDSVKLD